jgi:selenocysteine-specific elongation factor
LSAAPPLHRLALGVIGHVDHGKTALVRALTGMETDRLPEEQRRGVSIVLGFAHARFGPAEIDFIDMPGHERFVRTMISGATGMGAALLVVAANEGIKPQTVEHLEIAALLGLRRILPVVTKSDLVDRAAGEAVGAEAAALARSGGLQPEPPILVSTLDGSGLHALCDALGRLAVDAPRPIDDGFPWLPIDRAFSISGRGTVVTGTLQRGALAETDALLLLPGGGEVRLRGLQVHGAPARSAAPGQRVAVNLRALEPSDAPRGSALAAPGVLAASSWVTVELTAARSGPPLQTGAQLALLYGAAEVGARLRLLDRDRLEPGDTAVAQLNAAEPVFTPARERFVLRLPSPARTVGGGRVIDPTAQRLRRKDPATLARLAALATATPEGVVALTLSEAGPRGVLLSRLVSLAGLGPARVDALLADAKAWRLPGALVLGREPAQALGERALAALRAHADTQPNGLSRRRLAALLPEASAPALDAVLAALVAAGRLQAEGGGVRLPAGRREQAARAEREADLAAALADRLRTAGLLPPDLGELAPTPAARRALERLLAGGEAVMTFDRVQKRQLAFHREAVTLACERLKPQLGQPGLTVGEAGALLGVTRKFSVPLLEYLDTLRFTRRLGDRRVLGPAGKDC